jgi:hypothetical protein
MKISATIRKYIFFVLFAAIFVWLICIVFHPFESRYQEPQYQGKKLTDWAKEIDQSDFFRLPAYQLHPKQDEQAIAAIRQIGTNALPVALELCQAKDPWFKIKWEEWTHHYNFPALDKRYEGANIIWALGPVTKPIVPDLVRLLQSPDRNIVEDLMLALPGAGTNAIPPLIELLNSADKNVRLRAAIALGDFFRPKIPPNESGGSLIVAGSEDFRSQAGAAVPVLLEYLERRDIDYVTHIRIIRALGLIKEDVAVVVPILIRHIQNDADWMRGNYFWALGNFGTNAAQAYALTLTQVSNYAKNFQLPTVITNPPMKHLPGSQIDSAMPSSLQQTN